MRALAIAAGLGLISFAACSKEDSVLRVTGIQCSNQDCPPIKGDVEGGTYVVIRGNAFLQQKRQAKVYFGARQGTVVRFQSDSELIVQAPGGKHDETVDVLVVFEPGGQLKIPGAFKFIDKAEDSHLNIDNLAPGEKKK
jgi:hypothetical protein